MTTTISGSSGIVFPDLTTMQTGQQAVKAWVNFNGTGTVAIRAAYNVSSITDNGVGDYTVNFATAMVDANYAPIATTSRISDSFFNITYKNDSRTMSISQVSFLTKNSNSALEDEPTVTIAIFR